MKKLVLLPLLLLGLYIGAQAQFTFNLTGNPVGTAGWTLSAPSTYVNGNTVVLNDPIASTAGYIYWNTPINFTRCGEFTANFEFQIKGHAPLGSGDGMAFWFLTTAPAAINLNNMGMPNNSTGPAFFIDTHDDDAGGDNPLYSLRRLNNGNYSEGASGFNNAKIGSDQTSQPAATDTGWHFCSVHYKNGFYQVSVDNIQTNSGFSNLNTVTSGYFGFSSATTNDHYSQHSIRNVEIFGADIAMPTVPPADFAGVNIVMCEDISMGGTMTDTPVLADPNVIWWDVNGVQLPGAPVIPLTPPTVIPYTFYVSHVVSPVPPCGESPRDTVNIAVRPTPSEPNLTYKKVYCGGEPFQPFNPFPVDGIYWYPTPTGGVADTAAPVVNTNIPDTNIFYGTRIIDGCESKRGVFTIIVLPAPVASFDSLIKYGCVADTVTFINTTTLGDSAVWKFGDGTTVSAGSPSDPNWSPTHIYTQQDIYDVWLIVYNKGTGCVDSVTNKALLVHELESIFGVNDSVVCQGEQVNFTDQSNYPIITGATFYWDFGDGDTTRTKDPFHFYPKVGTYRVMHVTTDIIPCNDTSYRTIVVDSIGKMNFALDDTNVCEGDRIVFIGDYTTVGLERLTWDFGDGIQKIDINPASHAYDVAGQFSVRLAGQYRACPDIDSILELQVRPYLPVNLGTDTTMCPNGPGIVIGDAINQNDPNASWLWSTGDSTAIITVRHPGVYTVRTTAFGCSSSDSVEIFKDCYIDIPNSFTPNNDGTNDYFLPRQMMSKSVTKFTMKVFNRWGEMVFETDKINGRGWDGKFNGKDQPVGVYVYLIDVVLTGKESGLPSAKEHYQGNVTLLR